MTLTLSPDEAAAELGVSAATIRQWVREGRLAKLPMRRVRVLRTSIEALVNGYDGASAGTQRGLDLPTPDGRVDRRRDAAQRQAGDTLVEVPRRSQGRPRRAAPAPGRGRRADGQGEAWRLPRAVGGE